MTDVEIYWTLSPVSKLCSVKLKLLEAVVTPLDEIVIGFIKRVWVFESNLTSIFVEVPIPTDWLGLTVKLITSVSTKLCDVETDTTAFILCNLPVTWVGFDSNKYSKLLEPTLVSPTNARPTELVVKPTWVTIPT